MESHVDFGPLMTEYRGRFKYNYAECHPMRTIAAYSGVARFDFTLYYGGLMPILATMQLQSMLPISIKWSYSPYIKCFIRSLLSLSLDRTWQLTYFWVQTGRCCFFNKLQSLLAVPAIWNRYVLCLSKGLDNSRQHSRSDKGHFNASPADSDCDWINCRTTSAFVYRRVQK